MKRNAIKDEDRLIAHNSLIARMKCYFFISCERFLIVKRVVCNVQHLRYWHLLLKSIIPFHHEESPVSLFFVCVIIVSCDVLSDCRLYRFVWIVLPRAFQFFCYFRLLSLLFFFLVQKKKIEYWLSFFRMPGQINCTHAMITVTLVAFFIFIAWKL